MLSVDILNDNITAIQLSLDSFTDTFFSPAI